QYAFYLDPIQEGLFFSGNNLINIAPGGWSSVPFGNANQAGNPCPNPNCQDYNGGVGLVITGGMDNSSIINNTFVQIANDAVHVMDHACLDASSSAPTSCSNDIIAYNTFNQVLRIGVEWQGVAGTCWSGSCNFSKVSTVTLNRWLKGNYCYNITKSYYQTWCYSLVPGKNTWYINNSAIWNPTSATSKGASAFEIASQPGTELIQGNVVAINSAAVDPNHFGHGFAISRPQTGVNQVLQNNVQCGVNIPFNSSEGSGTGGTTTIQYNSYTTSACPNASNPQTSNVTAVWTSPNNQSFPAGGNGTWSLYATGTLPIRSVQFFSDGESNPLVFQEIADVNTSFSTNKRWLYHATFSTSTFTGAHTIKAVVTDVSGGTATITQIFTGPS